MIGWRSAVAGGRFNRAARQLGKRLRRRQPHLAQLASARVRLALWLDAQHR